MKIKVCGMNNDMNIRELIKLKPDYIGFIFYKKSKRYAGDDFNFDILNEIPPEVKRVGVFVNETFDMLVKEYNRFKLDYVQLHGNEPAEYCHELKMIKIHVIKAFGVNDEFDFSVINDYENVCDYFLFDTKSDEYGGTGKKFNWDVLKKYNNAKPVFLSGGIGLEDSILIKKQDFLNIHAIDINSRFETEPGIKDMFKLKKFFEEIRKKSTNQ
jgi:phosphoribosylanthranilate isomerase